MIGRAEAAGRIVGERRVAAVGAGVEHADDDALAFGPGTTGNIGAVPDRVRADELGTAERGQVLVARATHVAHAGERGDAVGLGDGHLDRYAVHRHVVGMRGRDRAPERVVDVADMARTLLGEIRLVRERGGGVRIEFATRGISRSGRHEAGDAAVIMQQAALDEADDVGVVRVGLLAADSRLAVRIGGCGCLHRQRGAHGGQRNTDRGGECLDV